MQTSLIKNLLYVDFTSNKNYAYLIFFHHNIILLNTMIFADSHNLRCLYFFAMCDQNRTLHVL